LAHCGEEMAEKTLPFNTFVRQNYHLMNLLLLGSGGREHAFAWKMAQSPLCKKLYIAPGNAGTAQHGENVAISATDFEAIETFVKEKAIDLVVVGPEDPLVKGIFDFFKNNPTISHIPVIGPSKWLLNWKAVSLSPKNLWSVTIFPLRHTKNLTPLT
jgi:hypothetical protein